ncbi:MAG: MAPEG family protein [Steroidobacteraceae bacterium]
MITALYAGLLGLLAIVLGAKAGGLRGKLDISIGDGGNKELLLAMRRHANFAEWVPIALILIVLMEMRGVDTRWVHGLGAGLVVARVCHALGLKADSMKSYLRLVGAGGTALIIAIASVWSIFSYFQI